MAYHGALSCWSLPTKGLGKHMGSIYFQRAPDIPPARIDTPASASRALALSGADAAPATCPRGRDDPGRSVTREGMSSTLERSLPPASSAAWMIASLQPAGLVGDAGLRPGPALPYLLSVHDRVISRAAVGLAMTKIYDLPNSDIQPMGAKAAGWAARTTTRSSPPGWPS